MFCPWWQHHEAAMVKMAYSTEQHVLLVKRFYLIASVTLIHHDF
jgi:hypothetical protein